VLWLCAYGADHKVHQMVRWQHVTQANLGAQYSVAVCCEEAAGHDRPAFRL